jgi:hypothetical protein
VAPGLLAVAHLAGVGAVVEDLVRLALGPVAFVQEEVLQRAGGKAEHIVRVDVVVTGFGVGALDNVARKVGRG